MKKKNFVTLILATVGGILFALGMYMALLPQWNAMQEGVITGGAGLVVLLILWLVRRRMEGKPMVRLSVRSVATALLGIMGVLMLGLGMCMVMLWNMLVPGIAVGLAGIVLLLCLIPLIRGIQD